jgi:hypothetical protein
MTSDPRLERYLTSLERVLKPFPVSDRAEIVTEIKSHVLSALERDPQARLDSVLAALGEPETVANRYLIERGMKLTKPSINPIIKWVIIGFMGTFAMLLIFAGVIVTRFTPLLHVDDAKDKVSLFGGLIEVDGGNGRVLINGSLGESWGGPKSSFKGSLPISNGQNVFIKFGNGKFEITNAHDAKMSWNCSSRSSPSGALNPAIDKSGISFDLSGLSGVKCELSIPENIQMSIKGSNGKLEVNEPHYNLNAELTNGKVELTPDKGQAYRYSIAVSNGKADSFESSDKPNAYSIAVHVLNGKISREK